MTEDLNHRRFDLLLVQDDKKKREKLRHYFFFFLENIKSHKFLTLTNRKMCINSSEFIL